MKLIIAVVSSEDATDVARSLTVHGFQVTRLSSSGGFLRMGNTTLLSGCQEEDVAEAVELIRQNSFRHTESSMDVTDYMAPSMSSMAIDVEVGGGTIFVVDVEQFYKV